MCGIVALSRAPHSSIPDGRRAILAGLLAIEDRGPDSVGVGWTRGKAEKVWYDKRVGTATKVARELDLSGKARIHSAIGHTRWASQGALTYDNAHPVVAENIVLVHNGCLANDDDLIELTGMDRVGEVDSWALPALIHKADELGFTTTQALELIEGDYAIAWLDAHDPGMLHLARGNGRPMCIGFTKRGDLMMASTPANLRRWATMIDVHVEDITTLAVGSYLQVRQGAIREWTAFTPAAVARTQAVARSVQRSFAPLTGSVLPRPLWEPTPGSPAPGKRGNPRKTRRQQRSRLHGITDLVANRPDDWWTEAEAQLGDEWARKERGQ